MEQRWNVGSSKLGRRKQRPPVASEIRSAASVVGSSERSAALSAAQPILSIGQVMRFAQREFAGAGDGVARIMAMLEWIHRNVDYVAGVSNAETTSERTFVDRAGVCRDFTHPRITFARALGIPARAVSGYALQLDPPDFHAIFEVYIENDWWLIDPTRLAPIEGIVRIGSGRDASDIAFLTSDQQCQVIRQTVEVSQA
jgi:transglutaminase-like putative cysteine protease